MTNDEIRKLLGGYATNTLTEDERKALFEAALDDQELFDALHQEQALKDLLADPVSREQIRQALEKSPVKAHAAWWSRWWTWAGAASAVAAAVLIVAVTRTHAPETKQQYAALEAPQPAAVQPVEKVESDAKAKAVPQSGGARMARYAERPTMKRAMPAGAAGIQNERKDELALKAPPAAPPPAATAPPQSAAAPTFTEQVQVTGQAQAPAPAPSQSRGGSNQAQSQQALQAPSQVVNSLRDQEQNRAAPVAITGALFKSPPPVSYSVLKRDQSGAYQALIPDAELKAGDAVRLIVTPTTSGYLSLSRRDASGNWERLFPETGPGLRVSANVNYWIPDAPIDVQDSDQNFRLALIPGSNDAGAVSTELRQRSQLGGAKAKTAPLKKESAGGTPLVMDLTIGPKKVP
jgi:hypothetical protein